MTAKTATATHHRDLGDRISHALAPLKPKLRGWLHAGTFPLATAAGIVLFGLSALYHRFYWGPTGEAVLRRLDHSNIFLLIAGTYTPFGIVLLHGRDRIVLLALVGGGLYSLGAVVYGLKRPDPSPRWFGFHEIFHACTVAAFVTHYVAISLVTYTL